VTLAGSVFQLLQAAIGRGYRDADFLSLFEVEAAPPGSTFARREPVPLITAPPSRP